jgi:hypothetical protein
LIFREGSGDPNVPAVLGEQSGGGDAIFGNGGQTGRGVVGISVQHTGVEGFSQNGVGVFSRSGISEGVHAETNSTGNAAVAGINTGTGPGVFGESKGFDGVAGTSHSKDHAGVSGHNDAGGAAGFFGGDVVINGNLTMGAGRDVIFSDFAEDFDIADAEVEPGTVMAIDQDGTLRPSNLPYDKKVAGVVSGAGEYRPAIVLDKQASKSNRIPIALVGKVCCKIDADYLPVEVGDLLTTSPTPGPAMKAADPLKAFGSVIGKALRTIKSGQGLIPVLVALQ